MFSHKISRRARASTIAAVAAAGVLALGSQLPGSADAGIDPFIPYEALTNPELAELRGGFSFNGFDFDIAIDIIFESFVNDIGLVSMLSFNQEGGVETNSTTFIPGPDPDDGQTVVVTDDGVETTLTTESTTIVHQLNENIFKSIVETSGNNLNITNTAQFDITISATLQAALNSFSANILSSSIGAQIGLSSLF
ncbi:MAG: hypothetical protein IID55_02070 [Proteobacteria bacterium]|nr:hypothetical protein [Pseudomonadota bacterium]